jgi:hypothetical protein
MPNPSVWKEVDNILQKRCPKCTEWKSVEDNFVRYKKQTLINKPKYSSWCKKCISVKQAEYHKKTWGPEKLQFTAYKRTQTVRSYLSYLRGKAVQRKKECISVDALETLWFAQEGKCALTGWDMTTELGSGVIPTNCSIDRIDSRLGYVPGNVQLVCRAANVAKHDLTVHDFLNLCKAVMEASNA